MDFGCCHRLRISTINSIQFYIRVPLPALFGWNGELNQSIKFVVEGRGLLLYVQVNAGLDRVRVRLCEHQV